MLQPVLAGATFTVLDTPGVHVMAHGGATLLTLSGMRAEPARRVDLCSQLADPEAPGARGTAIVPLHAGLRFADVAGYAARGIPLRNAMLAGVAMPHLTIAGNAAPAPAGPGLAVRWTGKARWIGDGAAEPATAGRTTLVRQGWLLWEATDGQGGAGALRIVHRPGGGCARAGELVFQLYRAVPGASTARALAVAFPADGGAAVETTLAPGRYRVLAAPAPAPARKTGACSTVC